MSNEVKDIQRFINEAAKRKKKQDDKISFDIKNSSIKTATDQKNQLADDIRNSGSSKAPYAFYFLGLVGFILVVFAISSMYSHYSNIERSIWVKAEVTPDDFIKVREYVMSVMSKRKSARFIEGSFNTVIPAPWKKRGIKALASFKGAAEIKDVSHDMNKLGKNPLFIVKTAGANGNISIYVLAESGSYSIFKIDDSELIKSEDGKDEKKAR